MRTVISFLCMCCMSMTAAYAQYDEACVGDIVDIGGVKALVFETDGDGHGRAIAVKAIRGRKNLWPSKDLDVSMLEMNSESGAVNTKAVYEYCEKNNISISEFPLFDWCLKLGEGWYIPSSVELEYFVNFYFGNNQELDWEEDEGSSDVEELTSKVINEKIIEAGGYPFSGATLSGSLHNAGIVTSTKTDGSKVLVYQYNEKKKRFQFKEISAGKLGVYIVGRAFYDF